MVSESCQYESVHIWYSATRSLVSYCCLMFRQCFIRLTDPPPQQRLKTLLETDQYIFPHIRQNTFIGQLLMLRHVSCHWSTRGNYLRPQIWGNKIVRTPVGQYESISRIRQNPFIGQLPMFRGVYWSTHGNNPRP